MSQSISRRSFLKCAGSGAVSLAAALLTGVCAAAQQPCLAGEPALLDGKAAVELLGYAPAPGLGGVLVYLSVENLSARTLPVGASYLHSRDVSTLKELARRWRPEIVTGFRKATRHEALSDILESIDELKYYRELMMKI